jgi:hypothetical protein
MDTRLEIDHEPTDMMCRRTPLLLRERFLWFDTTMMICTDSAAILHAAEKVGFVRWRGPEEEPSMRWEIASVHPRAATVKDWECKVTLDAHSLYLSMGLEQWFAFDLETGDGAGFVISDSNRPLNVELYLRAVAYNVGACLRLKLGSH